MDTMHSTTRSSTDAPSQIYKEATGRRFSDASTQSGSCAWNQTHSKTSSQCGYSSHCHENPRQKPRQETLPGYPRVPLHNQMVLTKFLEAEFCSLTMERMSRFLWLMSTQSHTNISALHRQKIKGRQIMVTEDPKLHLVWYHDRVFVKPLPCYLWCTDVQTCIFSLSTLENNDQRERLRAAMFGYLRTWLYLIRHESDFHIAAELRLLPERMTWDAFCCFSAQLEDIDNAQVCERYWFGEIRLTRLNFYSKVLFREWSYQRMHLQYGDYFAQFYGPLLFIFAVISVSLSALQVVMSVEQVSSAGWGFFWNISRWSGVSCALVVACLTIGLSGLLLWKVCAEWRVALYDRWRLNKMRQGEGDVEKQAPHQPGADQARPTSNSALGSLSGANK